MKSKAKPSENQSELLFLKGKASKSGKSAQSMEQHVDFGCFQNGLQRDRILRKLVRQFGAWPLSAILWSRGSEAAFNELHDDLKTLKKWYRRLVDSEGNWQRPDVAARLTYPVKTQVDVIDEFYQSDARFQQQAAMAWLRSVQQVARDNEQTPTSAARLIGTAMLLPVWARCLDADGFRNLCLELFGLVESIQIDWEQNPDSSLWMGVELPAVINSYLWVCEIDLPLDLPPAWDDCEPWYHSLADLLDSEGWPLPTQLSCLGRWLATHTRVALWHRWREIEIPEATQTALEWLLRNGLRLCWNENGQMLFSEDTLHLGENLLSAWRRLSTDNDEKKLLESWLDPKRATKLESPERSVLRDTRCTAVFRGDWRHKSAKFGIRFDQARCWLELVNRTTLIQGDCLPEFQLNGEKLTFQNAEFELNCWHTEDELDYLELEMRLSQGFVWQRQIAFARYDRFLMIGDALLGETSGQLTYDCRIPIGPELEIRGESETREFYLHDGEYQALLLPISLGEWKQDHTPNRFQAAGQHVWFHQQQRGRGMMAGMVIDLDTKRCVRPRTWRNLTVGQNLQVAKSDEALAWRFQLDDQQYLMYRSLGRIANRTFLGVNVYCDYYLGRFDRDGEAESLLSIE